MFGIEYQDWIKLVPEKEESNEVISPAKKAKEEAELKLRKEQEAKNKFLQEQKLKQQQQMNSPQKTKPQQSQPLINKNL